MDFHAENAFRILGLPVTASKRDIVKRVEVLQTLTKIGHIPHYNTDLPWISEVNRNEETIKKALQLLENPNTKMEHLLSWFWVIDEHDNLAINALNNKDVYKAVEIWSAATQQKDSHHLKNLATLELILAAQETDADCKHLNRSISYWAELTSSGQLLNLIKKVEPELSKKLTNVELTRLIGDYLTSTVIPVLNRWSDKNKMNKIGEFFEELSLSKLPSNTFANIKEGYIEPLSENIDKLCSQLSDINDEFEDLYTETITFFENIKPLFEKIMQTEDNFLIESYGDKIGKIILDKAIHYGNNTDQWQISKELCELAEIFITGPLLKDRLDKNLKIISDNIEQKNSWGNLEPIKKAPFLGTFYGIGTTLYGSSNHEPYSMSYETTRYFIFFFIPIIPLGRYRVRYAGDNQIEYLGKVPFRFRDKLHLALGILAIIFGFIYVVFLSNSDNYSSEFRTRPSSPSSSYLSQDSPNKYVNSKTLEIDALKKKILNVENKLSTMKSEILSLEGILKSYNIQLERLKKKIEGAEEKIAIGLSIDVDQYYNDIDEFNGLVQKYNITFTNYDNKINEYNRLIKVNKNYIEKYKHLTGIK